MIKTIAFDADDTLWHNERIFISANGKYKKLLSQYHNEDWIEARLDEAEMRNIKHFSYGIKGFALSMIETALELMEGRVKGDEIKDIITYARKMISSPIGVLERVKETMSNATAIWLKQKVIFLIRRQKLLVRDLETSLARSR